MFETVCTATQEFCAEHYFFDMWAWSNTDITYELKWLSDVDKNQSSSSAKTDNGASTESDTDAETEIGSDSDSDLEYHNDIKIKNADLPYGAGFSNNDNIEIIEDMKNLTLTDESIIFKQKMFKSFQFLVWKKTELHVWKSAKVSIFVDLNTIKSAEKSIKEFIA